MIAPADFQVIRRLAEQYAEIAAQPVQDERRGLWRRHNSLKPTRVPIAVHWGFWNAWAKEMFADSQMQCRDPFLREHERNLRMLIFHDSIGDDQVLEPWITLRAAMIIPAGGPWGMQAGHIDTGEKGGAFIYDPPLKDWRSIGQLAVPRHQIDEAETARRLETLLEAAGGCLSVHVDRSPVYKHWNGDISYNLAELRGLSQLLLDLAESPREVHRLAARLRDGTLKAQAEAEAAGDWSTAESCNQATPYCEELPPPLPNSHGHPRKDLFCFIAAQEFTLVSPRMFDEFVVQYQLPILENFGLVHYGCCEDLTNKIKVLRQIKNLRSIAVAPLADLPRCAEQIGSDYVISWRPNPTDMICSGFDRERIKNTLREGLTAARGCAVHINLKDIETVEGQPERLAKWVQIARDAADSVSH